MAEVTEYRFLPWARRGIAGELEDNGGAPLPARASTRLGVTISGLGGDDPAIDVTLYGPGDILGLDTRMIVRTEPRANTTDVEPNYLPAVEFDPPDLPWMFTPGSAGSDDRLLPWLVLICVDRASVDPPRVGAGQPLPFITIPGAVVSTELPDLSESWAWAHAQVSKGADAGPVTSAGLHEAPGLNVSRLVCPRRLRANREYFACLVPAFDTGAFRGLTGEEPPHTEAGPAWDVDGSSDVRLPVYFHWEFATGPAGDFEALASLLKPFEAPSTIGVTPMYVGDARSGLPKMKANEDGAILDMDGALRSPLRSPARLGEVVAELQTGLQRAVEAPADHSVGAASDETEAVGPPLYGGRQLNRHRVPDGSGWMRALNLDPRARAAAGLGAEVVRDNQEEFAQASWEQVGDVIAANELLSRMRFSLETLRRVHERHLAVLSDASLLLMTAPMHYRIRLANATVAETAAGTSLPDSAADPALRRLTSSQRPAMKHAARRAGLAVTAGGGASNDLYGSLAAGRTDVDPNVFIPDGIVELAGVLSTKIQAGATTVDFSAAGLPTTVGANEVRVATELMQAVEGEITPSLNVRPRADLRTGGLVTAEHLDAASAIPQPADGRFVAWRDVSSVFAGMLEASRTGSAAAFLAEARPDGSVVVEPIDVDRRGRVVARGRGVSSGTLVGEVAPELRRADRSTVSRTLSGLPPGSLRRTEREVPTIGSTAGGQPTIRGRRPRPAATPEPAVATNTLPPLVTDAGAIARFEQGWRDAGSRLRPPVELPTAKVVPFAVATSATTVLSTLDPTEMVPRRVATMLRVAGADLLGSTVEGVAVTATHDRILVGPELPFPMYEYVARQGSGRFFPGADDIPPNAITLLETNPRFIESFMVGVNHEMSRELLWRRYPGEPRATVFRHFWDWFDGNPDIEPIHTWPPSSSLGLNNRGTGEGGQLVLLVRGDLLRRYPNTVIYAWRAEDGKLKDPYDPAVDIVRPVFAGRFDPDFSFVGFPLTDLDVKRDDWFFVLQEQPTEPRFGFDEPTGDTTVGALQGDWLKATWTHTGTLPGRHLEIEGNALEDVTLGGVRFVRDAAHLAALSLQKPFRVAVLSDHLIEEEA